MFASMSSIECLALTHSLVLEHFQQFLDALIARLQSLFLRLDPQLQFLFCIIQTQNDL